MIKKVLCWLRRHKRHPIFGCWTCNKYRDAEFNARFATYDPKVVSVDVTGVKFKEEMDWYVPNPEYFKAAKEGAEG